MMTPIEKKWAVIDEVSGQLQAELLKGLLIAGGVEVVLSQEGAGRALGLNMGPLGRVQLLVPVKQIGIAQSILDDYYSGLLSENDSSR